MLLECQILNGSGSVPSCQPMMMVSISLLPLVSFGTSVVKSSTLGLIFTPIFLYCSAATWRNVSRVLFPWFVTMVHPRVLPSFAWKPSERLVSPASFMSCSALVGSKLYAWNLAVPGEAQDTDGL